MGKKITLNLHQTLRGGLPRLIKQAKLAGLLPRLVITVYKQSYHTLLLHAKAQEIMQK